MRFRPSFLFVLLTACTTEVIVPPPPTAAGSPDAATPPDAPVPPAKPGPTDQNGPGARAVGKLTIGTAKPYLHLGSAWATQGHELLAISATFVNDGKSDLPLSLGRLSIETTTKTKVSASAAASKQLAQPCTDVQAVPRGRSVTCEVAFELRQDEATGLHYRPTNDDVFVAAVPKLERCHGVKHLDQTVTPVTVDTTLPISSSEVPPDGTYVAQHTFATSGSTTFPPLTMRVKGATIEESYTLREVTVQMTYQLKADVDHVNLDLSCVSPVYDDVQKVAATSFHWDAASSVLYMSIANGVWVGLRKLP
jgi:hypothetical protein